MSAEATGWVYRHSPFKGATFTVHHAIADTVSDQNDNEFWMAQDNLADKARLSARAVREGVQMLVDAGLIEPCDPEMLDPDKRRSAGRPTRWRFLFPEDAAVVYESRRRKRTSAPSSDPTPAPDAVDPRQDVPTSSAACSDVTQENPSPEPKGGKPRSRFEEFDALMEVWGSPDMTREESAFFAKVARSLQAQGKSPAEILDRGKRAKKRHADCTPNVLLTRWSSFAPPNARRGGATWDDVARRDAEERRGE